MVPEPESSVEKIYPSLSDLFAGYLDKVESSQRNMDASAIQRMNDDRERSMQRILELEGSLGRTLQSMRRVEMRIQACEASVKKEEPKKAPNHITGGQPDQSEESNNDHKDAVPNRRSCASNDE